MAGRDDAYQAIPAAAVRQPFGQYAADRDDRIALPGQCFHFRVYPRIEIAGADTAAVRRQFGDQGALVKLVRQGFLEVPTMAFRIVAWVEVDADGDPSGAVGVQQHLPLARESAKGIEQARGSGTAADHDAGLDQRAPAARIAGRAVRHAVGEDGVASCMERHHELLADCRQAHAVARCARQQCGMVRYDERIAGEGIAGDAGIGEFGLRQRAAVAVEPQQPHLAVGGDDHADLAAGVDSEVEQRPSLRRCIGVPRGGAIGNQQATFRTLDRLERRSELFGHGNPAAAGAAHLDRRFAGNAMGYRDRRGRRGQRIGAAAAVGRAAPASGEKGEQKEWIAHAPDASPAPGRMCRGFVAASSRFCRQMWRTA
jgi:hypothetical protein